METVAVSASITPSYATTLGGVEGRSRSRGVVGPIELNAFGVRLDSTSEALIIVSLDLLYPGRLLRAAVERALPSVAPERILLSASHTHYAPMTDDTKPRLGMPESRFVAELAELLHSHLAPFRSGNWQTFALAAGEGSASHSVNRRRKRFGPSKSLRLSRVVVAPNVTGSTDETVITLVARDSLNRPLFVVWNYACHPVALPNREEIAPHFPGTVRDAIRSLFVNPGLPVVYLQGFSGDVRPSATARRLSRGALRPPYFSDFSELEYQKWSESLAGIVVDVTESASPVQVGFLTASRLEVPSERFISGGPGPPMAFQVMRLGSDICVASVSAEVMTGYAPMIRAMAKTQHVLCVGCTDHTLGYIPTDKILREGGYEGGGFCDAMNLGSVVHDIENQFLESWRCAFRNQ